MTVVGIDTSSWNMFPTSLGCDFVFNKATQGTTYVDPTYPSRHLVVRSNGKIFGAYHFMETGPTPAQQVSWFASHANIQPGDIVALDFEDDGSWGSMSATQVANIGVGIMAGFRAVYPNNRVVLYCNQSVYETIVVPYRVPLLDGLWIADYNTAPPIMPYVFWQYSSSGIDSDRGQFATAADLAYWAHMVRPPVIEKGKSDMFWFNVDLVKGRAWATFEVGLNSSVVSELWIAGKALWGDIKGAKITFVDDNANGMLQQTVDFVSNKRVFVQAPSGASDCTIEWDPTKVTPGTVFSPYVVWK